MKAGRWKWKETHIFIQYCLIVITFIETLIFGTMGGKKQDFKIETHVFLHIIYEAL